MKKSLLLSLLFTATCKPVLDLNLENKSLSDAIKPVLVNRFIGANKATDKQANISAEWQRLHQDAYNIKIIDPKISDRPSLQDIDIEPNVELTHDHLPEIILAKIKAFKSKDSNERNDIRKLIFDLIYIGYNDRPAIVNEALLNSKIFKDIEDFSKYMDSIALIYQNKLNSVQNNELRIFLQKKVDLARQLTNPENVKKYLVKANFDWLQEKNLLKNESDLDELANNINNLQFDITDTNNIVIDKLAAIHEYCMQDVDLRKLRALILLGANINLQTSMKKNTALHVAAGLENYCAVKELLKFGAKTDIQDQHAGYPISLVCYCYPKNRQAHNKILKTLLKIAINKSDLNLCRQQLSYPAPIASFIEKFAIGTSCVSIGCYFAQKIISKIIKDGVPSTSKIQSLALIVSLYTAGLTLLGTYQYYKLIKKFQDYSYYKHFDLKKILKNTDFTLKNMNTIQRLIHASALKP